MRSETLLLGKQISLRKMPHSAAFKLSALTASLRAMRMYVSLPLWEQANHCSGSSAPGEP